MTSQTPDTQAAPRWKRLVIICSSTGAGSAFVFALIVGGALWYTSHPKPPKPWNTSAIKATYDYIDTEGEKKTIVFYYILENETESDYRVENSRNVVLAAHLLKENSLSVDRDENLLRLDWPLFVPAKQRVRFAIHFGYPYLEEEKPKPDATVEERRNYRNALARYVEKEMWNLDGFVLLDDVHRYQINFVKGW